MLSRQGGVLVVRQVVRSYASVSVGAGHARRVNALLFEFVHGCAREKERERSA